MPDGPPHDHIVDTGKGSFGLAELGRLLPGMAEIMPLVGDRMWKCYYAGKCCNGPLAAFQLKEAINLMNKGSVLRPKYASNVERFINLKVTPVRKAIESEDWPRFEAAFELMVAAANAYHDYYEKPYLRWKVPDSPPPDLDMTPRA